ncbi:MAG: MFS transporter [Candidatus Magasanikbacteria bacterium]
MNTKITQELRKKLSGNFRRMFFIQAFQNIRMINVVVTLFYVFRGLNLTQVFYLSIIWSITNIIFEVPSSYLADRWGRKKTIIFGTLLYFFSCIIPIFAHSFLLFAISIFLYALSFACFSGTDDAIIYDTNRELGQHEDSLRRLGQYYSSQRVFKILAPFVGAFLARDLNNAQFVLLLMIDVVFALVGVVLSFKLVEPKHHYLEVEKIEAGVMRDALKLIKNNPHLIRAIINQSLIFIASFITWRYHQVLFTDWGLSVLMLGIGWSVYHFFAFILSYFCNRFWSKTSTEATINILNFLQVLFAIVFLVDWYFKTNVYWLFVMFLLYGLAETARWPFFSHLFNKHSNSFNRATTLSLSNLTQNILNTPMLFLAGILVAKGMIYPFYLSLFLVVFVGVVFYLPSRIKIEKIK